MEFKLFDSIEQSKIILGEKELQLAQVSGKNICITRLGEKLVAFENECPHIGADLHQGRINFLNQIVCPLHSYKFDLKSGEEENVRCKPLRFVSVVIRDEIYLNI